MTNYLSLEEILRLHHQLIEDYGGSHGVRDENRLQSVALALSQEVFGAEQYPDIYEKAAVYLRNIIGDHPFADGNKRTAVTVAGIFLMRNGHNLASNPRILEDFAVEIATKKLDVPAIAEWLEKHTR
jgi:death-on-curing protein